MPYDFEVSDDPNSKHIPEYGSQEIDFIPVKNFYLDVDSSAVIATKTVQPEDYHLIEKRMMWRINKNYVSKSDFIMMDILVHNNWKRPIYFASPAADGCIGLQDYLQLEGIVYRLVPIKTPCPGGYDCGRMKPDLMYKNLMEKFDWGRINEPDVYIDHFHERTIQILRVRQNFGKLAEALLAIGRKDSAIKVLDRIIEMVPSYKIPHDFGSLKIFACYYQAGDTIKANKLVKELFKQSSDELKYYFSLKPKVIKNCDYELRKNLQTQQEMIMMTQQYKQPAIAAEIEKDFNLYYQKYAMMMNAGKQ